MKYKYNKNIDCRYVNTSGMTMDKDCHERELYGGPRLSPGCLQSTAYTLSIILFIILLCLSV